MIVRIGFWPMITLLFSLFLIFLLNSYIFTAFTVGFALLLLCKQRLDYCRNDQTESKHVALGLNFYLNAGLGEINGTGTQQRSLEKKKRDHLQHLARDPFKFDVYKNLDNTDTFTMWGNHSSSPKLRTSNRLNTSLNSPSVRNGRTNLNVTMPVQASSPPVLRQRRLNISSDKSSMLSAAGPLLSSPFMPQIKRALGLEPKTQLNYSQRRHSTSFNTSSVASPASPGSLPHVRLNKSTRLSLSDKNSSMLSRSSTVKIAPPVPGRVASPSLHQMRNDSMTVEERGTPDTYAVISALKERRKRSINTYEETQEHPVPQAKRRRQESQQSNASTSSMPSLPDNLPDLTNTDFTMRLETPGGIKRPSRPSQDDSEEWHREAAIKRPRCDMRNNSILSSLSSSQRFINTQISKRKDSSSFSEKENERSPVSKTLRNDPPKLTHLSMAMTSETIASERNEIFMVECQQSRERLTNGHTEPKIVDSLSDKPEKANESSTPVKRLPSMKKTASIYAGLGNVGSFRKAQYANVVATIDDYDSDREAEQNRVKQMLHDIDESFSQEEAKKNDKLTTASATSGTTSAPISTVAAVSTVTSTLGSTTSSVLSALEKLSKSPTLAGQADKDKTTSAEEKTPAFPVIGQKSSLGSPVTSPTDSPSKLKTGDPPSYFATVGAGNLGVTPPAVSVNQSTPVSLTGSTTFSTAAITAASGFMHGQLVAPTQSGTGFGTPSTSTTNSISGLGALPAKTSSSTPASGGFTFGAAAASTTAAPTTAVSAPAQPLGGFSFGASTSAPSATTASAALGPSAGFSFNASASSTQATVTSSATPVGGFSFGSSASVPVSAPTSTPAATVGSLSGFGTVTSTPAFAGFGSSTASTGGFNFGSSSTATTTSDSVAPAGFSFGTASTQSSTQAAAFGFGAATTTTAATSKPLFGFETATASQASSGSSLFGAPQSTAPSSLFVNGATTAAANAPAFSFGTSSSGSGAFGTAPTTTSATPAFSFGSSQVSSAGTTPFAAPATTTQAGFSFGAPASTAQSGFSFGAPPSTAQSGFSFGAAPQTATSTPAPFSFGAGTATATPFGTSTQPSAAASSFNFGQATTQNSAAPGAFSFGNATGGTTNQTPAFGSANQTPAFGASSQTPSFGSAGQTPAFGSGSTNQTPAFGAANQTPAFGAGSSNQPPAFGSTNQATAAPAFGSGTANTSSVFGNVSVASPTFGKSHSVPSFGTTDSSGTFNFGQPAPNVNPFGSGQTTPAKQTGSAFGMQSNDTTPKQQTGALFQFGNQSNTNGSANQGFNFAAAASNTNQNTGGFNFTSTPAGFGTAPATPTQGAFSVGTGDAARPPRIVTKARRRGQRR